MTDDRVVEVVLETIRTHLSDLNALNLSNNQLRSLRAFAKLAEKAPNIEILFLEKNRVSIYAILLVTQDDKRQPKGCVFSPNV